MIYCTHKESSSGPGNFTDEHPQVVTISSLIIKYTVKKERIIKMSAYNVGKIVGVLTGMLVGLAIVFIMAKLVNKDKKFRTEYDERQTALRGIGFKYAFYAMAIYAAVNVVLGIAELSIPMEPAVASFSYITIGCLVDVVYCIFKDCYWGLNNRRGAWGIIMFAAGVINALSVIMASKEGRLINNGQLSTPGINLLSAILLIGIAVALWIKSLIDKKEGAE